MNKMTKKIMITGVVLILGALTVGISANMNNGPDYTGEAAKAVEDAIKKDAGDSAQYYTDFVPSGLKDKDMGGYHIVTGKVSFKIATVPFDQKFAVALTHDDDDFTVLKVQIGQKVLYQDDEAIKLLE